MRARTLVVVLGLVGLMSLPSGASTPAPHVTDIAGDANAANGQSVLTGGATTGTATPVSYAPADLLSIRYSSKWAATPVGNGITHTYTGLEARIQTAAPPVSGGPTLIYRLNVDIGSCGGFVQYYANGPASAPTDGAGLEFRQLTSRGCAANVTIKPAGWVATVEGNTLLFSMPLSGLTGDDRANFSTGSIVMTSSAEVRTQFGTATAPALDTTPPGESFIIGSDRPADVPCTVGCP